MDFRAKVKALRALYGRKSTEDTINRSMWEVADILDLPNPQTVRSRKENQNHALKIRDYVDQLDRAVSSGDKRAAWSALDHIKEVFQAYGYQGWESFLSSCGQVVREM